MYLANLHRDKKEKGFFILLLVIPANRDAHNFFSKKYLIFQMSQELATKFFGQPL